MITGYRRVDGKATTPDGYPLPVTGKSLTNMPVVKKVDGKVKEYPETFVPGKEELDEHEIRMTCCGSGNPIVRRAQAATSWLIETGNGGKFIFDVGGGAVQNLWSLEIAPALLDKLFITHLHLDHVGDFLPLYDAMGWARNSPLRVWGSSGYTKEMGIEAFCEAMRKAVHWHVESKVGLVPSEGTVIEAHEFDYGKFSPDNPQILIYDEDDVKIHAFPVVHCIWGSVGYRLEYKGLSMTFHGDGTPSTFEAEQAKNVDVFMHEAFLDAVTFSKKANVPLPAAKNIVTVHTTPDRLGQLFDIAKPKLGVGYHYFLDDDTVDPFFSGVKTMWGGATALAQDFMVINITPEQIVSRIAQTGLLHWPPPAPKEKLEHHLQELSKAKMPEWLSKTALTPLKE